MNLIIGGAYQGKLEYAEKVFGKQEVFTCSPERAELDFSKPVLYHLEDFVLACVREGIEAREYLRQHRPELDGKVIICTDLSQGIVPVETQMRALPICISRERGGYCDESFLWIGAEVKVR